MYGLDPDTIRNIKQAIENVASIDKVILYGSRAKGNYRNGSDIDITLLGKDLSLKNSVYPLMDELEELYLPYTFDISVFEHIDNENLIDHIHRVGKVFYGRVKGLPKGWEIKKIGKIGTVFNGNSINAKVKKEKYTNLEAGLPYIATKDISYESVIDYGNGIKIPDEDKSSFKIASQNTILICAEGGSAGRKIAFTDQEVCFGNKLFALSTTDKVNSRFVYYYYFSPQFQEDFASQLTGIIGGVSMAKFKKLKVPLPSPPEQQRIVEILDKAFVAIDKAKQNAEQNFRNTEELFKSYLNDIFKNQSDAWRERPLNELCVKERIITYGVIKLGADTTNGVPCLRTSNVRWLNVDIKGIKLINEQLSSEYSRTILRGGEVLVNVRGTLGGVAIVSDNMVGWNVSREVAVVPINKDIVDPLFISYFIGSDLSQMWFDSVKKGAAYVGINIEDLRRLPVYFPEIDAQRIVVERIKDVQGKYYNALNIYERKMANLQELKKSILQKAYEGEL